MSEEITNIASVEQDLKEQLTQLITHCKNKFSYINQMPILYFIIFLGFLLYQTFLGETILKHEYSIIEYVVNPEGVKEDLYNAGDFAGDVVETIVSVGEDIAGNDTEGDN